MDEFLRFPEERRWNCKPLEGQGDQAAAHFTPWNVGQAQELLLHVTVMAGMWVWTKSNRITLKLIWAITELFVFPLLPNQRQLYREALEPGCGGTR